MNDKQVIYLDNAATTKLNKDVLDSYEKASSFYFANSSSIHGLGQNSARIVELSRKQILEVVKLEKTHDVIFTSGATESNNLAIIGYCLAHLGRGKHIITTCYEHPSVLEACKFLETYFNFEVTYLPVNRQGHVEINNLLSAIRNDTILVSIMAVNNEIGAINNIEEIAKELKKYAKIVFHVDAVQAFGKIKFDFSLVDMITITGHKIHGPKGVGCLIKNTKISLASLNNGGGQEKGERSGTLANELVICLAKAIKIANNDREKNLAKVSELNLKLMTYLKENPANYELNSDERNPFVVNFSLKNRKASVVVEALSNEGIMVSSTSACHSKGETGSYVVKALGKSEELYNNTVRVSFDESNTLEEVDTFIKALDKIVKEIKHD